MTDTTAQFFTTTDGYLLVSRDDIAAITYTTATIDGTERHAVRRTEWSNGNVNGTTPLCSSRRSVRTVSIGYAESVTCAKCLKRAVSL